MNSRGKGGKRRDTSRDGIGFVALPTVVLDSDAYIGLGYPAKALIVDVTRQLGRNNNGQLRASVKALKHRGWSSNDVLNRALKELVAADLLFQTVKGYRPNKASWYAVTWYALASHPDYDAGAEQAFRRGAYLEAKSPHRKSESLTPPPGVDSPITAPGDGVGSQSTAPGDGAVMADFGTPPSPGGGDHLDIAICMHSKSTSVLPANNQRTPKTTGCGKGALRKTWGWAGTPRTGNRAQYRWPITALLEVHAREFAQIIH